VDNHIKQPEAYGIGLTEKGSLNFAMADCRATLRDNDLLEVIISSENALFVAVVLKNQPTHH